MRKVYGLILFYLLQQSVCGQEAITIGLKTTLYSNVLKEDRELWLHVPDQFKESSPCSIVYLLDGEINFHYFSTISDFLFRRNTDSSHQLVVVGIINTHRTRDLTPTRSFAVHPQNQQQLFGDSGGGDAFLEFLNRELKPYMTRLYPKAKKHVLAGHSFGGLTVIDCLLKHPDYFDYYIANDPSLWWDSGVEATWAAAAWKDNTGSLSDKKLFLSRAGIVVPNHFSAGNGAVMKRFSKILARQTTGLVWKEKTYPDQSHGTIALVSNIDALRFLFSLN